MLYVVATPIGNLKDITLRGIEALSTADCIIAENPSHSKKLLDHHKIGHKRMIQFAEHNELKVLERLVIELQNTDSCLITDAGTPGISDPGFRLVRACVEAGIQVVPIPGASAALTALMGSGLPTDRFLFVGFLPKTEPKLMKVLEQAKAAESTLVFYESPQRIKKTLAGLAKLCPDAQLVLGRELTKIHEEFIRGSVHSVEDKLKKRASIKGELVGIMSFK